MLPAPDVRPREETLDDLASRIQQAHVSVAHICRRHRIRRDGRPAAAKGSGMRPGRLMGCMGGV